MKYKKEPKSKLNRKAFVLYLASAFAGFLVAGICIDLATKTGYSVGYIGAAIMGIYVLGGNFYQLWGLLKGK